MPSDYKFDAGNWSVTVGGQPIQWTQIEITLEQFHTPAQFAISAPLQTVNVPKLLTDTPSEVVISYAQKEWFVGQLDDSNASGEDGFDDLHLRGRDLSARFALRKVEAHLPNNITASELVKTYCQEAEFSDLSKITATQHQIGVPTKDNSHLISRGMSRHDILFDLAESESFAFRVYRRQPFFGLQPEPGAKKSMPLVYHQHFNRYAWSKSHTNSDVSIRVISWDAKAKARIAHTAGSGSLVITKNIPGIKLDKAKAIAEKLARDAGRSLLRLSISDIPGDAALDDILWAFEVSGIAPGIDQTYWPERIHHVITQDSHVMDVELYNAKRILQ
ncbi:hypothetical protein J7643_19140 [bacterium]|nr:hypothetical protein [bacterium]